MAQMSSSGCAADLDKRIAKSSQDQIEQELFQAADKRIAELNKTGVAQGLTDISEPKCQHQPVLVNMGNFDDWTHEDLVDKGGKTWELETDRRLRRMNKELTRETIEVNGIFKDVRTNDGSTKKCRHVMFIGPAGSGKTTLLRRIAQGKYGMLKDKLLIDADLRTFSVDKKILPSQGLLGSTFSDWKSEQLDQRYQWILKNSEKVGFFVDSLDTLPFDLNSERPSIAFDELATPGVILHNLLAKELFSKSIIISSSREFKVRNMHPTVRPDRCILLDGLEEESVKDLIDGFLGKDKGAEMKKYIDNECPDIWPLLSIPVFLVFSTISFAHDGFKPKTMSGILIKYFLCLIHSPHALEKEILSVLYKLMPMSFEGIRKGQVLFTLENLMQFELTPDLVGDLTSLIPQSHGTGLSSKLMQNDRFFLYFNHQTQQETLSALHVLSLGMTEFKDFVRLELYVATFGVVRRLVCGILLNDEVLEATKELTEIADIDQKKTVLLESLRMKLKQHSSREELLELFIDLNEVKEAVGEVIRSSVRDIMLIGISLSPSDVQAVAFVMKHSEHLGEVYLAGCNLTARKMEIIDTAVMQSNLKLKMLNVGGNENIGSGGMFHLGRFVRNSTLEVLSAMMCGLKSEHLEKFADGAENASFRKLDVSLNGSLGPEGMCLLGKLVKNNGVKEVVAGNCNLNEKNVQTFAEGLGEAKFRKLDVSRNEELGPKGMCLLGKLVKNHDVKEVIASNCNPNEENVQKFAEGLGEAKFDSLNLSFLNGYGDMKPDYVRSLLNLLPRVNKEIKLQGWKINEIQQRELQDKLNEICSPTLSITLGEEENPIELKARNSETENQVELPTSEETPDNSSLTQSALHKTPTAVAETGDEEMGTTSGHLQDDADSEVKITSKKKDDKSAAITTTEESKEAKTTEISEDTSISGTGILHGKLFASKQSDDENQLKSTTAAEADAGQEAVETETSDETSTSGTSIPISPGTSNAPDKSDVETKLESTTAVEADAGYGAVEIETSDKASTFGTSILILPVTSLAPEKSDVETTSESTTAVEADAVHGEVKTGQLQVDADSEVKITSKENDDKSESITTTEESKESADAKTPEISDETSTSGTGMLQETSFASTQFDDEIQLESTTSGKADAGREAVKTDTSDKTSTSGTSILISPGTSFAPEKPYDKTKSESTTTVEADAGYGAVKTETSDETSTSGTSVLISPRTSPAPEKFDDETKSESTSAMEADTSHELVKTAAVITAEIERRIKTESTRSKTVCTKGGFVENIGSKVSFFSGAFGKDTEVQTSVITDFSDCPKDKVPIAPTIKCSPSGKLNKPALVEIDHWALSTGGDFYVDVYRKDDKDSERRFFKKVLVKANQKISFYTDHFTDFEFLVEWILWFKGIVAIQIHVYISPEEHIACVCCLKNKKINNDVTKGLEKCGFVPLLPLPESAHIKRDNQIKISVKCTSPSSLVFISNDESNVRTHKEAKYVFCASEILRKCKQCFYRDLGLQGKDLTRHQGKLKFRYSHKAENDDTEQEMQKKWPITITQPTIAQISTTNTRTAKNVNLGGQFTSEQHGGADKITSGPQTRNDPSDQNARQGGASSNVTAVTCNAGQMTSNQYDTTTQVSSQLEDNADSEVKITSKENDDKSGSITTTEESKESAEAKTAEISDETSISGTGISQGTSFASKQSDDETQLESTTSGKADADRKAVETETSAVGFHLGDGAKLEIKGNVTVIVQAGNKGD